MSRTKVGVQLGEEVAGRTIVGGRGKVRRTGRISVPVGIEKVLYLAAVTPAFRARLFANRQAALAASGLGLSEDEALILRSVPDEQLGIMIDNIDPRRHGQRKFIRSVAACAASVAAASALVQCEGEPSGGDLYIDAPYLDDAGGARPDAYAQLDVYVPNVDDAGGARPDVAEDARDVVEAGLPDVAAPEGDAHADQND